MLKLFAKFRWYDWLFVLFLVGVSVGQAFFDVHLPYETSILFDHMLERSGESYLYSQGVRSLLFALGSLGANAVGAITAAYLAASVGQTMRRDMFKKVQSFGFEEMNKFSTASLITRSTNDITQVQNVMVMMLRVAISAPITAVWAMLRIGQGSTELITLTAWAMVGGAVLMGVLAVLILPKFKIIQQLTDRLNAVTRQNLTGLRVVKAYNADNFEQQKFDKVNQDLKKTNIFANTVMVVMMPLLMVVMNGINLAIFWMGAQLINDGSVNFPALMDFSGLIMQVLMAFVMFAMMFVMVPRAQVSATRVLAVFETNPRVKDPEENVVFDEFKRGEVEFENVSFCYPEAEAKVLDNISFKVKRGQTVAFIGSTGSGKSTLINLVPRFYDTTTGSVKVSGVDVKNVSLDDLRAKIGYVPQTGVLFRGTIKSNIEYGFDEQNESHEAIEDAAYISMADEFIGGHEDKYDAKVSQAGKNFSGGQKQRMSIARAVAIKPEILIFDDSFSALDYKTDREVRDRLKQRTKDSTCLIVAQRIGTIMDADLIVVLEKGKVASMGKHEELLNSCEVYKEIALSQLSEEELAL